MMHAAVNVVDAGRASRSGMIGNGYASVRRMSGISARSSMARLASVNEADEEELDDRLAWSPRSNASSAFEFETDDDDLENRMAQPARYVVKRLHREDKTVRRASRSRVAARRPEMPLGQAGAVAQASADMTMTLDENKHMKLVALFYWRRRALEKHFTAWKRVLWARQMRQKSELELLRQYAPSVARRPERELPPRHRQNPVRQDRSSVLNEVSTGMRAHDPPVTANRIRNLREEYRRLKATERAEENQQQLQIRPATTPSPKSLVKRVQVKEPKVLTFKEKLPIYYRVFQGWRDFVEQLHEDRTAQEAAAAAHYGRCRLTRCFRAWVSKYLVMRREKRTALRRADIVGNRVIKRRRLHMWISVVTRQRILDERVTRMQRWYVHKVLLQWRRRTSDFVLRRYVDSLAKRHILTRFLILWRKSVVDRLVKKQRAQLAAMHYRQSQMTGFWRRWTLNSVHNETVLFLNRRTRAVKLGLAVHKWKRRVERRHTDQEQMLQADWWHYTQLVRHSWIRWGRYLTQRRERSLDQDQSLQYYTNCCKRRAIQQLLANRCSRVYTRARCRGASEFFVRKVTGRVFRCWYKLICDRQKWISFLCERMRRRVIICFIAWKHHARRTLRLRSTADLFEARTREKILRGIIQCWRHNQRIKVAWKAVCSRHDLSMRRTLFRAWRTYSNHRSYQRGILHDVTTRRSRFYKQSVVREWFSVAMSKRCRQKLVCLFQKKYNRKRLQLIFLELSRQSKLRRLRFRTEQRTMNECWCTWRTVTTKQKHRRASSIAATQFHEARSFANALSLWKMNARRWIMRRRNNQKAIRFLVQHTLQDVLHSWYRYARRMKRRCELIHHRASIRISRLQHRFLKKWYEMARQHAQRRADFHQLWSRVVARRCRTAFDAWCQYRQLRVGLRNAVVDAKWKHTLRTARCVIQQWRIAAFRCKRRRIRHREIVRCLQWRILYRVFNSWNVNARKHRHNRENMRKANGFHREYVLLTSFCGWLHSILKLQVIREKQDRTSNAIRRKRMRGAVRCWQNRTCDLRKQTYLQAKAAVWFETRKKHKGITWWREFQKATAARKEAVRRASVHRNHAMLHSAFRCWIIFASDTRAFKRKLRSVFQTGEDDIRRKVVKCWRRYKQSSTLVKRANGWRRCKLLKKLFGLWKAQVAFAQKMKSNILVSHQLLLANALRMSFTCWFQYTISRRKKQYAMRVGDEHFRLQSFRLSIRRLRTHLRHARAVECSKTYYADHLLLHYFDQWKSGIAVQRRRRELKSAALLKYRQHQLETALDGWRRVADSIQSALHAQANALRNRHISKHIWKAWRRVVTWSQLIRSKAVKREASVMTQSFQQWCAFVHEEQRIRQYVGAAVAHVERVVVSKIWLQWLRFVEMRRVQNRLEAKAMAFYALHVLVRRSLDSWRTYTDIRILKVENRIRADEFYGLKVMRGAFELLMTYVGHRKQREETKQMEGELIRDHHLRRAIRKWHTRSLVGHKLRCNINESIRFFRQRRLSSCVTSMIQWTIKRKEQRRQLNQVRLLFSNRSLSRHWAKWCAFCRWRRRHKHLLRLFRTNQLCDYFAIWRSFVSHRRSSRALQARARVGYRAIVQTRLFKLWVSKCSYWKAKRRADQWRTYRTYRQVMRIWARRVRVVTKMRRMFQSQDSVRLELHFMAWKRRWWYKQLQTRRLADARIWFGRLQRAKCFGLWVKWLEARRQERQTIAMAEGFSRRFIALKYFQAWCQETKWTQRKRVLLIDAKQHFECRLRLRVFTSLRLYAENKQNLHKLVRDATVARDVRGIERAVHWWCQLSRQKVEMQALLHQAKAHASTRLKEKAWRILKTWLMRCRLRRAKVDKAKRHYGVIALTKSLRSWTNYMCRLQSLRKGLQRFKARYFQNMADVCFFEWKALACFRKRLRRLREASRQSTRRHILHAWYCFVTQKQDLDRRMLKMRKRWDKRRLQQCVEHWEQVTTDAWIYTQLTAAGHKRHNHKCAARAVVQWKNMHARYKWRARARQRHADSLRVLLHRWKEASEHDIEIGIEI